MLCYIQLRNIRTISPLQVIRSYWKRYIIILINEILTIGSYHITIWGAYIWR